MLYGRILAHHLSSSASSDLHSALELLASSSSPRKKTDSATTLCGATANAEALMQKCSP